MVAARLRSAAVEVALRHGGEDGVEDDELGDAGGGVLAEQRRALRGRAQHDVGDPGQRRAGVVGQRDRAGTALPRQLQRLDDRGGRARVREADRDVAFGRAARPTSASCARRRRRWFARRSAGTCARRRGRSAPSRRCRRSRAGARVKIRSAARSNASGSRIDSVSSSAWIEVRNTFCAISAPVSSGEISWCSSAVGRRL